MKYRTVIEVITDAENENEAIDIAGEFLRGNIESGVQMKCRSTSLKSRALFRASIFLILISTIIGVTLFGYLKSSPVAVTGVENVSAVHPPLNTGLEGGFKESWQEEKSKKVLEYIKK